MIRSDAGTQPRSAFSIVVLPDCVPPATTTLSPLTTAASRNVAACAVSVPRGTRSSTVRARTTNLRTLTAQCSRVMSGMTTCSRLPSGSIASTNGTAQVESTAGHSQHPLDEVAHLRVAQYEGGELAAPVARHEHPAGIVDPHLLDGGVVEERLQRSEPGDGVEHRRAHGGGIGHRSVRERVHQRRIDQPSDGIRVPQRIDAAHTDLVAHLFAHPLLDHSPRIHATDGTFATRVVATSDPRPVDNALP